jgi:hypothetical protein
MDLVEHTSDNEVLQLDAASMLSDADGRDMVRMTRGATALENQAPHDSEVDMQTDPYRYDTLGSERKEDISSSLVILASAKPLVRPSAAAVYDAANFVAMMTNDCTVEVTPKLCDIYLRNHRAGRLSNLKCFPALQRIWASGEEQLPAAA